MAVTDHLVKLPMRQPKKARSVAEPVARQTCRTQYRVLEGYSQRGVFFPQSGLFLCCFVFGLSKGAQAGILSPFKCQNPPLEELLLRELLWAYDLREALKLSRCSVFHDILQEYLTDCTANCTSASQANRELILGMCSAEVSRASQPSIQYGKDDSEAGLSSPV